MPVEPKVSVRKDTRGLPEGYDPHKLYEYRRDLIVDKATGLESFLYKYIPWSVIKSFAIAIDPFHQFKVAPGVITPANRVKYRQTASVLQERNLIQNTTRWSTGHGPNYKGYSNCWNPVASRFDGSSNSVTPLPRQTPFPDYLKDTTKRTRLVGSSQGELEFFKSYINSPPRRIVTGTIKDELILASSQPNEPQCEALGGIKDPGTYGVDYTSWTLAPSGSSLSSYAFNALKTKELAFCYSLASTHALSMFKDWSPLKRDYTLFRNLAELKDLPRGILQLQESLGNLRKVFASMSHLPKTRKVVFDLKASARDVPKEYLSYHFGWKQTYKDIVDLLSLPEKMSKRFEFALARSGKPTTFRTKRTFSSTEKDPVGFDYERLSGEYDLFRADHIERESEVRLVINATFDFPPLNAPSFRRGHFFDRVGAIPRVTDIYNLVPWTWLVDWFTGLGNYVEVIDNINSDPSLINWGMITAHTSGKLITEWQSKSDLVSSTRFNNVYVAIDRGTVNHSHTSQLVYECQIRKDMAQILDVKRTSVPGSLSLYQKSILGALLASRNGKFRST